MYVTYLLLSLKNHRITVSLYTVGYLQTHRFPGLLQLKVCLLFLPEVCPVLDFMRHLQPLLKARGRRPAPVFQLALCSTQLPS